MTQVKAQFVLVLDNSSDSDAADPLDEEVLGNANSISRRTIECIWVEVGSILAYSRIWITLREEAQSPGLVFCNSKLGEKHTIDMPKVVLVDIYVGE